MAIKFPFTGEKNTSINVEFFCGSRSVDVHIHDFYELVLVKMGSCIYKCQDSERLLVAGDVFLMPPYFPHGYEYDTAMEFYNCQFYAHQMGEHWQQFMDEMSIDNAEESTGKKYRLQDISMLEPRDIDAVGVECTVIHPSAKEEKRMEEIFDRMREEQSEKKIGCEHVKASYLAIILTELKRIQQERDNALNNSSQNESKKVRISKAIDYVNENYMEQIELTELAGKFGLSTGHFRELFKKATGLAPLDYINRMRVARSLEFIKKEDLTISEAAARVGIYDSNYFSRLFKKIMGYSPKYFKNISK